VLQVVLGEQTFGEILDFVVAVVELEVLAELVDEAVTDLQVLEDGEDGPDFGVGIELDAAEAVDDLSMVAAGADFGVGIASCTVIGWTALEAEHMKQVVQILASVLGQCLQRRLRILLIHLLVLAILLILLHVRVASRVLLLVVL